MDHSIVLTDEERQQLLDSIPKINIADACKENIQPRHNGRSVAALKELFETTPSEREAMLQAGHSNFEDQIADIEEQDDPLQIYLGYIEWTIQMYPQGQSVESNLIGLLKDATDRFKNDRRYKNDPRYLKVWIEYANWVSEPKEIFLYLIRQKIGQSLSLFYEEYASYYEKLNKLDEAAEVYELGIKEHADPIKRLEKSFVSFKARAEEKKRKGLVKRKQTEASIQMENLRSTGQRTMLGHKIDSQSRSSFSANVFSGLESRFGNNNNGASSSSSQSRKNRSFGNDRPSSPTTPSFSVYVEPSTARSSILPTSSSPSISLFRSNSLHITPSASSQLENQRPVEKLEGATLPQKKAFIRQPTVEKFEVYVDPELADEEPQRQRTLDRTSSMLSVLSTDSESTLSKLRKNPIEEPIQNKRIRLSETHKALEARFKKNQHRYLKTDLTKGRNEFVTILKDHDFETSFEEMRAQRKTKAPEEEKPQQKGEIDEFKDFLKGGSKEEVTDLTTETLAAKKSIDQLFKSEAMYTQDEEDLTWNNSYQAFDPIHRQYSNENE